jgi:hypothetical protein
MLEPAELKLNSGRLAVRLLEPVAIARNEWLHRSAPPQICGPRRYTCTLF